MISNGSSLSSPAIGQPRVVASPRRFTRKCAPATVALLPIITGCGEGSDPLGVGGGPDGPPAISIESFAFPTPGGPDDFFRFDINDAGDITAGRSLLRHTGEVVTYSQIIQTRAVAVNGESEVLLWVWDSAGHRWGVTTTPSLVRRDGNGAQFIPITMNNHAEIVGVQPLGADELYNAVYRDWETDSFVDLHAQAADALSLDYDVDRSRPRDINLHGEIVGSVWDGDLESAVLWNDGTAIRLGSLNGIESAAYGINDSGQIVGERRFADGSYRAFLWEDGRLTDLGTLGGPNAAALAINDLGMIAGYSTTADGRTHAFVWHDGVMYDLGLADGATDSFAHAINNAGQIVGSSAPAFPDTGTVWTVTFTKDDEPRSTP